MGAEQDRDRAFGKASRGGLMESRKEWQSQTEWQMKGEHQMALLNSYYPIFCSLFVQIARL